MLGFHGAGMTNIMFMQPGSVVVEIIGKFDGRMLPLCGYHGLFAAIFGIHHYIYYYDWKNQEMINCHEIVHQTKYFLESIRP